MRFVADKDEKRKNKVRGVSKAKYVGSYFGSEDVARPLLVSDYHIECVGTCT